MRVARRTLTLLVFGIPLVILLVVGVVLVRRYYGSAERDLKFVVATEATRALGHEVRVGNVTLKGGYAYVDDVQVAEGKTLAERGAIITARQVVLDFNLWKLLFEVRRPDVPLFANVKVIDPVGRVARNRHGVWNFQDLLKPKPGAEKQRAVGRVEVVNGTVSYSDAAFPRNPKRPDVPFTTQLTAVNGELLFYADSSTSWDVDGRGVGGQIVSAHVIGTYEPDISRLFLRIDADRASLPAFARLLPPDVNVTAGLVSGQATIVRTPEMKEPLPIDLQADLRVVGATVTSARLAETVSNVGGQATVANGIVTLKADAGFAGSQLHAEGTVSNFKAPSLNGWASGSGLQLQRVLTALKLDTKVPKELRQVAAVANVRADLRGPVNNLQVTASGPATVRGQMPGGPVVPNAGTIQIAFSGPLSAPRLVMKGTLPRLRFQKYEAYNVWLSAVYTPERMAADFSGAFAGGRVSGRANLVPAGKQTRYAVTARVRGMNVAAISLGKGRYAKGTANADIIARGRFDQRLPQGVAEVQVSGAKYNGWAANSLRGRIRTAGDVVRLDPVTVQDEKGAVFVSGTANVKNRTLNLFASGNALDLERIQREIAAHSGAQQPEEPLQGVAILRGGRITGTFDKPRLAGTAYGYNLRSARYGIEYVKAEITATEDAVNIVSGQAYRFPAVANVSGSILRPLKEDRQVSLRGGFQDLSVQDLVELANSEVDATGVISSSFSVTGPMSKPVISLPDLRVRDARVGDFDFRSVTASARYNPDEEQGTWYLENVLATRERTNKQLMDFATISGSARITGDKRFTATARVERVDLDLLAPYVGDFANVKGVAEVGATGISGVIKDGKVEGLAGTITASTQGLTINGIDLGDLHGEAPGQPAVFALSGNTVTSDNLALGSRDAGFYLEKADPARPALVYNVDDQTLNVSGKYAGIQVEKLRQALIRSPYVANTPEGPVASYVKPITDPIEGALAGSFTVAGTTKDPTTNLTWVSQGGRVQGEPIDEFRGEVNFNRQRVRLANAVLRTGETNVTASGVWQPNVDIVGTASVHNLSVALIQRWFPGRQFLRDLSGTAEDIVVDVSGDPANPSLSGSALLRDLAWVESRWPEGGAQVVGQTTPADTGAAPPRAPVTRLNRRGQQVILDATGRELHIKNVEIARFVVNDPLLPDKVQAEDVRITFLEQGGSSTAQAAVQPPNIVGPPPAPPPPDQLATLKVYATAESDFSWHDQDVFKNPHVHLNVRVPEQRLSALAALMPNSRPDPSRDKNLNGTIQARLDWTGTLHEPNIDGNVLIQAPQLRFGDRPTTIQGLLADLRFNGDTMTVAQFSAKTQVVNPRTGVALKTSEPITLTGDIALHEGVPGTHALRLDAPKLSYADSSLPGLENARLAIDDLAAHLTVGGTIAQPHIAGRVEINQADFRVPSGIAEGGTPTAPPILPSFDIDFFARDRVRISSSALSAQVRTAETDPVHLGGSLEDGDVRNLRVNGTLVISEGTLVFPTARFRIDPGGTVALRYPQNVFGDPTTPALGINVDLTATTRITAASATDPNRLKRYTITVEARGPINSDAPLQIADPNAVGVTPTGGRSLRLAFRADPPDLALSSTGLQRRVTGLLGGETAIQGLFGQGSNIGSALRAQVTSSLSNVLFPELFERLVGRGSFEELTIDVNQLNEFTLRVSRQLIGPIYGSYWRRLTGGGTSGNLDNVAWEFKLSYRFQPHFQFSWTTDDQRTNAYLLEGVFRF